ncbi:hypothetical protein ENBRE01_0060 [Enteropsectra breve]|nr:hypothetical protein ENBRE01_0060 [Enteropsectra breve]
MKLQSSEVNLKEESVRKNYAKWLQTSKNINCMLKFRCFSGSRSTMSAKQHTLQNLRDFSFTWFVSNTLTNLWIVYVIFMNKGSEKAASMLLKFLLLLFAYLVGVARYTVAGTTMTSPKLYLCVLGCVIIFSWLFTDDPERKDTFLAEWTAAFLVHAAVNLLRILHALAVQTI